MYLFTNVFHLGDGRNINVNLWGAKHEGPTVFMEMTTVKMIVQENAVSCSEDKLVFMTLIGQVCFMALLCLVFIYQIHICVMHDFPNQADKIFTRGDLMLVV